MKILIFLALHFISINGFAQNSIANTKWLLHTGIPVSGDFIWEFRKDSSFSYTDNGTRLIGTATFKQVKDSLLIHKVWGTSPCPEGSEGWYRIEWVENGEKFVLHLLDDSCPARSRVYPQFKVIKRIREDKKNNK